MDIKILAFDLDGTTVVGHKDMPEENKIALTEAEAKGVYLVPCTGRIKSFLPADVSALPNIRYVISSNGASVDDIVTGENIYKALIPVALTKKVQEIINCYDLYQELYVDGAAYTLRINPDKARANPDFFPVSKHHFLTKKYTFIEDFDEFIEEAQVTPEKINLPYIPDKLRKEIWNRLSEFPELILTSSIPDNIEINCTAANKGAALRALAEHLGYSAENCFAIGDNGNDAAMLEYAGISVAMGNSSPEAFAAAKYTTDTCNNCGLAKAIRKYILE